MSVAILVDVTRCTGCERCTVACGEANQRDLVAAEADRATTRDGLSANRWCTVVEAAEGRFARKSCMHCLDPSCVSACLVGGLEKTTDGPVVYDPDKCIGCRYCMLACPFHVPRYEWSQVAPFMRKCDLCAERLRRSERPACVEACPHDVLSFGPRDELLEQAHHLIRDTPGRYLPHVWGETELGGTSV
ncbi:MAG: 4Fe-4S dicluster domain-containing protein, partial [Acidobacteria bacterium]|nr:4Fe-4S dicluster domain-containing protein [Acidobacteriota bacterium]